jgi:hypothetical protein
MKKEFLERADEIMEEISCWNGLENEVLKLFCLFSHCNTLKHEGGEWVNINYVRQKVYNLLISHPILLAGDTQLIYISMRIQKENAENLESHK